MGSLTLSCPRVFRTLHRPSVLPCHPPRPAPSNLWRVFQKDYMLRFLASFEIFRTFARRNSVCRVAVSFCLPPTEVSPVSVVLSRHCFLFKCNYIVTSTCTKSPSCRLAISPRVPSFLPPSATPAAPSSQLQWCHLLALALGQKLLRQCFLLFLCHCLLLFRYTLRSRMQPVRLPLQHGFQETVNLSSKAKEKV